MVGLSFVCTRIFECAQKGLSFDLQLSVFDQVSSQCILLTWWVLFPFSSSSFICFFFLKNEDMLLKCESHVLTFSFELMKYHTQNSYERLRAMLKYDEIQKSVSKLTDSVSELTEYVLTVKKDLASLKRNYTQSENPL